MNIQVKYFAHMRQAAGNIGEEEISLETDATMDDLVNEVIRRHPNIQPHLPSMLVTRNHEWSKRSARLVDGDEVGMMPPVSGG